MYFESPLSSRCGGGNWRTSRESLTCSSSRHNKNVHRSNNNNYYRGRARSSRRRHRLSAVPLGIPLAYSVSGYEPP